MSNKPRKNIVTLKKQKAYAENEENFNIITGVQKKEIKKVNPKKNELSKEKKHRLSSIYSKDSERSDSNNIKILMKKRANKELSFTKNSSKNCKIKKITETKSKTIETDEGSQDGEKEKFYTTEEEKTKIKDKNENLELIPIKSIKEYFNEKKLFWENNKNK